MAYWGTWVLQEGFCFWRQNVYVNLKAGVTTFPNLEWPVMAKVMDVYRHYRFSKSKQNICCYRWLHGIRSLKGNNFYWSGLIAGLRNVLNILLLTQAPSVGQEARRRLPTWDGMGGGGLRFLTQSLRSGRSYLGSKRDGAVGFSPYM